MKSGCLEGGARRLRGAGLFKRRRAFFIPPLHVSLFLLSFSFFPESPSFFLSLHVFLCWPYCLCSLGLKMHRAMRFFGLLKQSLL